LRGEVDRVFNEFTHGWPTIPSLFGNIEDFFKPLAPPKGVFGGKWPCVDVSENDKVFTITAELPGLNEKDIEVDLNDDILTIKGEKKSEHGEEKEDYHLTERSYGSFRRSFRLPDDIEADKITADFEKGILHVNMPKSPKAAGKTKRIDVKAG